MDRPAPPPLAAARPDARRPSRRACGAAPGAPAIGRILTVGAQYACWRDYRAADRAGLFLKWHVAMPLVTALCGYLPGRRLGWLEDLPAGVANEWSFRRARMERSLPPPQRPAVRRALRYYRNAPQREVVLAPDGLGVPGIGHFGLFHARFEHSFWADSLAWLGRGADPLERRRRHGAGP